MCTVACFAEPCVRLALEAAQRMLLCSLPAGVAALQAGVALIPVLTCESASGSTSRAVLCV